MESSQLNIGFGGNRVTTTEKFIAKTGRKNGQSNRLAPQDRAFHDWYRFVLSYPPHLVQDYLDKFKLAPNSVVLDPFCGTGTTLVEAKLSGMKAIGIEANTFPYFATSVKVDWSIDPENLLATAFEIESKTNDILKSQGIDDLLGLNSDHQDFVLKKLNPEAAALLLKDSISPLPLHKTLVLLDCLAEYKNTRFFRYMQLALANALVFKISNLHFGPEVGVKNPKDDSPVISAWSDEIKKITADLKSIAGKQYPTAEVFLADARNLQTFAPQSVDAVITSPPYPNEKDYTRTTRLESVVLGFINNKAELRGLKKTLVRSNTRGVYKNDNDDQWISENLEIQRLADEIENRRIQLGKDSGFERMYSRVTRLYFGGMAKHLAEMRRILKPGAQLAYVVGDQASYLRVKIQTGKLLSDIARVLGYELIGIDLFRTRLSTVTREQLREEVVVLRWPGK
ncbi:MAG: DNA methyltransferase [Candidatus Neomarinimicrobiota bacterium]